MLSGTNSHENKHWAKTRENRVTMDRIFLDPKVGYPAFQKPLRIVPIPTINRFRVPVDSGKVRS